MLSLAMHYTIVECRVYFEYNILIDKFEWLRQYINVFVRKRSIVIFSSFTSVIYDWQGLVNSRQSMNSSGNFT